MTIMLSSEAFEEGRNPDDSTDSSFLIRQLTMRSGSNASRGIYRLQAIRIKHHAQGRLRHAIQRNRSTRKKPFHGPLLLQPKSLLTSAIA